MAYTPLIATPTQVTRPAVIISNSRDPMENPATLPFTFDFSANAVQTIDLTTMLQRGTISGIQTMYFDNSGNAGVVIVSIEGTEQVITMPSNSQGYVPVLCSNPIRITFDGTAAVAAPVNVELINVPMPLGVWKAT